jgi:hypothetical protein
LLIDIDAIATQVAGLQVENPLGASANSTRAAAVNFSPGFQQSFPGYIQKIKKRLQGLLELALNQAWQASIDEFVNSIIVDLATFKGNENKLDFTYPFRQYQEKQRLSFHRGDGNSRELLKCHKLAIAVKNPREFEPQLRQGLENYIDIQLAGASEEEREDLRYILDDLQAEKNLTFTY